MFRKVRLPVLLLIPFMLACGLISNTFNDVQNLASTAESLATAIPIETLVAVPTALEEIMPTLESIPGVGDVGDMFNPQGDPVDSWNDIPVMLSATAGQEFPDTNSYSFKVPETVENVQAFYDESLTSAGWQSMFGMPGSGQGTMLLYSNEGIGLLTITVVPAEDDGVVVVMQLSR